MAKIKFRRDTAANWAQANPVLAQGEPGFEHDTGLLKIGNGSSTWLELDYSSGGAASLTDDGSVVVQAGSTAHWIATQRRNDNDTDPVSLRYDSNGNLYALTNSYTAQGTLTIVTKYTAAGAVAWQKTITDREGVSLAIDSSDQAYVLTKFVPELQIIKFSTAGSVLWKKNYNYEEGTEIDRAFLEEKTSASLVVAIAVLATPNYTLLMDISAANGSVNTKKTLEIDGNNVFPTGIDVTDDGDTVYVTGYYYDGGNSINKMFIEKMDSSLVRVWSKSISSDSTYDMYGGDCASDAQGNVYAVGVYQVNTVNSQGSTAQSAGILTKLNSSGAVQWTRRIGPGPCGGFATGLTATDVGDVYLSAVTFVKRADGQYIEADDFIQEGFGSNKLIVARYNTQGAVIWQRYVDVAHLYEDFDDESVRGQAISVYDDKFAVDGNGWTSNTIPFNFSGSDDDESDYFVAQLPTDGTELTIGDLQFTESRVPGRFVTLAATDISSTIVLATDSADNLTVTDATVDLDTEVRIANNIVKSEVYSYTFGADGTLTIPNDGDLRLTQTQVGFFTALGGSENNNDDITSRATTVDSQGNMYIIGEESDDGQPFVVKLSPTGQRLWNISIEEDSSGDGGRANGVAIHPTTGNVMVVCEFYSNYTYSALVTIDQDTGRILSNATYSDDNADVYLNDIAYNSLNDYVLAGSKYGEFSNEIPVTAETSSTTGMIKILRSAVPGVDASDSWQIGGTGITPFENIAYIERYTGLTGTVREGSGAVFNITDNGNGTYSAAVTTAGTNYLPGHKIKILGSALGGVDVTNDIIIEVQTIVEGGGISGLGNTGTAAGTEIQVYSGLSGTNYNVGSGFEFTFEGPRYSNLYSEYQTYNITNQGTNYVENDIIVIAGTSLGGTSPANDLTVRVYASGGIVQYVSEFSGTSQSTTWKLETTTQVDFSLEGAWSITYPLSRENLLITEDWSRTFGTNMDSEDRLYAVAVDSGNNIIAVGQGRGLLEAGNTDDLAMVYKFNSSGTLQWARKLNETNDNCYAKSVITISTDIYVTHDSNDSGDTVVTKLDTSGNIKWQRITDSGDDSVIARTADGNILVTAEAYNSDIDDDALKVFLLTPSGETVYKRWVFATTDADSRFKNGRCLATDSNSYYITSYFYANNYDSSIAARLPIDGSGTGEYGSFRYTDVNAMTGSFYDPGLNGTNYDIDEVDLEGENNYAGPLAEGEDVYIKTTSTFTASTGTFYVDNWNEMFTIETVRDTDGGNIVFADGTTQNTSATDIPQRRYTGQRYTLGMRDRGHHILCTGSNDNILVPYNARVEFPIGTTITIVNDSGGTVYIGAEGGSMNIMLAGDGDYSYFQLSTYGVATLLKIGTDRWVISGNVQPD